MRQSAVRFFYSNAGYSWDAKTETQNQGRWRTARELARAEKYANEHNWQFDWEDDWGIRFAQELLRQRERVRRQRA